MKRTTSIASLLIAASFVSTAQAQVNKRVSILGEPSQATAQIDQLNLEPVTIPSESIDLGTDPNARAIIYNPKTGEEIAFDLDSLKRVLAQESDARGRKASTGNLGAEGSALVQEESSKVLGDDNRIKVSNTKAYPYRYTVKLVVLGQNDKVFGGTGIMIGDRYILTAGHNVYNSAFGGSRYAKEIAAVPAMAGSANNTTSRPFGSAEVTNWLVWNAWTSSYNASYDIAVLELDKPIGNTTGWAGFEYTPENNLWGYTAGYPNELLSGVYMYKHNQTTLWGESNPEMIYHKMDATKGQSGSGIWELYEGKHYVFAVHTGEHTDLWNRGVRITSHKFDIIYNFVFGS